MVHSELGEYCEFEEIAHTADTAQEREQFMEFVLFCVERLNRGETVQAIWHDYLDSTK